MSELIETFQNDEMFYYISADGRYLGAANGDNPYGGEAIYPPPEYGDQIWLFSDSPPYWSESPSRLTSIEDAWREEQMSRVSNQLLMMEDEDPDAEPGTPRQWRDYRIELRKWTETNPDFPNSSKRPVAPS
ncbi:hypothetical protein CWC48_26550 [Pseudomonas sp. S10E 269]|uniref:hypothetical protein n=1 Tax=unclassified Pseudomonas TaxID=196821 RepID=UPI000C25CCAA|nr:MULTISPECIES: hypothetical protein [unclassified Pseudomonas]PJK33050.1 hypothetical protein CWC49_06995 [Pseudomonas sp. S09F 262]PJK42542.1 hypothetical protein CWC48_26550 [Pseudomonas sp. S10E 269]